MTFVPNYLSRRGRIHTALFSPAVVALTVWLAGEPTCRADDLAMFRALPDNRIAIRTSFGLREAEATDATHVRLMFGMSVTRAAGRATSYRILSFREDDQGNPLPHQDERY